MDISQFILSAMNLALYMFNTYIVQYNYSADF